MSLVSKPRPKVFYGWYMVAAAFGIQFLVAGLFMQSFGAYVAVLEEEFGWSKATLAGAFSFTQFIGGSIGPVQGVALDRFGPRPTMRAGIVCFGLGFLAFSQVNSILGYYGAFILLALGFRLGGFFPLSWALVNWFERRRARALSTMSLGVAVGGLIVPVVALSLENLGFRTTAAISGVIIVVIGLPLVQFIRSRPEDYGEVVDGIVDDEPEERPRFESALVRDFTLREALRTPAFWLVSLGHGAALLVVGAVSVHVISHLKEDLGYSVGDAALVVTLMTGTQVVGMLLAGVIGDRYDKRVICAICMIMHMTGLLLVTFALNVWMVIAFAMLHGAAWGIRGPLMQAIRADYFGRSSFGAIMGISATIIMIGQVSGPLVAGVLADLTGNYELGFTLLAVLAGMGSSFFIFAKRPPLPETDTDDRGIEVEPIARR